MIHNCTLRCPRRCVAAGEQNEHMEDARWQQAMGVQLALEQKLEAVEERNDELEQAASRLFEELEEMKLAGQQAGSTSLEQRLCAGEQMLASVNQALAELEQQRDAEVDELQVALEHCQRQTRRLQMEQQMERRETAELLAELAAGEEASVQLHCTKLQEIENLHCSLRESEAQCDALLEQQELERREHAELMVELANDVSHTSELHARSLREIETLHRQLRKERDERQRLIVGELAELTDAKARLVQLAAEKQQLLAARSLERAAHATELEKVKAAHTREVAELKAALAASEEARKILLTSSSEKVDNVLRPQQSSVANQNQPRAPSDPPPAKAVEGDGSRDLTAKMVAKQASMIVALREQLAADKAAALKEKQAAVEKVRAKAQKLVKQNGKERREAEAMIRQLRAKLSEDGGARTASHRDLSVQ